MTEKKSILVVDDQNYNIETIIDTLQSSIFEFNIYRANTAKLALEIAKKKIPDVIITDWDMPEMSGIDLIEELKKEASTKDIPVIIFSGTMITSQNLQTALTAGAFDYIRKPIDKIELEARVFSALRHNETMSTIKNERKQFLSILDSIPEIVYVADIDTHEILFANKHLKKTIGRDITGEVCYQTIQGKTDVCEFCTNKYIKDTNEPYFWEYYNPILDKHFYVMDRKIKWTDQKEVRFELATDITERKKAEEKLTQLNHRLEASMQGGDMAWWEMELPSGDIIFNPNKALMLGRKPEDFNHYNDFMMLLHPDDHEPAMQAMHKLINGELNVYKTQYRIKTIDNNYIWFDDSGIITSKENGKIVMTGIVRNITQQKQAEKDLRKSEEKFRTFAELAPFGLVISDNNEQTRYVNPKFVELFGYTIKEMPSINEWWLLAYPNQLLRKQVQNKWQNAMRQAIETGSDMTPLEYPVTCKDGRFRHIEFRMKSTGNINVITFADITDRKQAEEALRKSEEKYRLITENASDVIWILNITKEKFTYISPSVYNLRGYTPEEAMQQDIHQSLTPESAKEVINSIEKILPQFLANPDKMSKKIHRNELRQYCKDGSIIWIETTTRYQFNKDKEIEVIGISRNIDERKKQEQALELSRKELVLANKNLLDQQKMFMIGNVVIFKWQNTEGWPAEYVSENSIHVFGYNSEDFISGKVDYGKLIHKDDIERVKNEMYDAIHNNLDYFKHEAYRIISKSGKIVWLHDFSTIIRNDKNEITHFFGYVMDVTDQKEAEEIITKQNAELKKANRLKSEFLANMSHEIRTPMNAVIGFAEILNEKLAEKPEYKSFIDGIVSGGKNLILLINDILDLSKIEAGRLEINPEQVDLLKLIEDIKQIFSVKFEKKNVEFVLDIDKRLPHSLLLDQTRIRQVLFNLVGNAIKFTHKGSVTVSVNIEGDTTPDSKIDLYFEVKDTGIGIPENQLEKIFQAFRQVEGQQNKYGGTGLGLAITRRLTEAMNGTINVKSELGKGSVFSIHFKSVVVPAFEMQQKTNEQNPAAKKIAFSHPQILIVDDVASNRDVIKYHVTQLNCRAVEAEDGEEALDFLKKITPDLILMDIQMPVMDGFTASKLIRKQERLKQVPIIALTALAMKEQEEMYKILFDDYLKKPIELKDLVKSLMQFLPYTETAKAEPTAKTINYAQELAAEIEKIGQLPDEFTQQYETELLPLYEEAYDIMDINISKEFALKIIEMGVVYKMNTFVKYGTELKTAAEAYKLSETENILERFKEFIAFKF